MRISENKVMEVSTITNTTSNNVKAPNGVEKQGSQSSNHKSITTQHLEMTEENTAKLKEAVNKMNEMLHITHSSSKFLYHEGLDRYYVTVVDKETEEIVREIPPKKLLDAYYEMQKMLGMIVDEKI